MSNQSDQIDNLLSQAKKIFITSHIKPDPDALGSLLGTLDYLLKKYPEKEVGAYLQGEADLTFAYLKNFEKIKWVEDVADFCGDYDTLIFVDASVLDRFTDYPEKIDLAKHQSICIDHHKNPPDNFTLNLSDSSAPSASQLVYSILFRENKSLLDSGVCEVLLTGIMGDTNTFTFISHKNSDTLLIAKELVDAGQLDIQVEELKFSQFSAADLEVMAELLKNTQKVDLPDSLSFMYSYLPTSMLDKYSRFEIDNGKSKWTSIFLRQLKGYDWGFVVTPRDSESFYISFRSTPGKPNVRLLANIFDGGGHDLAAGAKISMDDKVTDVVMACTKIVEAIKNNKLEIVSL